MLKNRSDLYTEMARGALIITPNNRLSNQLLRDFMRTVTSCASDKPHCLPYAVFLSQCFHSIQHQHAHDTHPVLLNSHQTQAIWQNIISHNSHYPCTEGLLQKVQDAWTRCQLWGVDVHTDSFLFTPQTQQFQTWHREFLNRLEHLNAITDSQIIPYCMQFSPAFQFNRTNKVIWVSFDNFTPQQQTLRAALEDQGYIQQDYDLEKQTPKAQLFAANDSQDELIQLVAWLHKQIEAKTSRIAVIVPDLQQKSQALQRYLLRSISSSHFDISLGKPITDYPLVTHALHWLGLSKKLLNQHQVRLLLHSPYLGGALSEFSARSTFLEESSLLQEANVPLATLCTALKNSTPQLAKRLEALSDYPLEASPNEWICHFQARLTTLGFPGDYPLNSSAYQYFHRFQTIFDDFRLLYLVHPKMNRDEALHALHAIGKATIFQIKKTPAPIQILGLLEASGCEFDAVWVTGLTDQCLPQKVNLSPFIPMSIQREQHMPHALPERELSLATQLLERLQNGSQVCILSYPKFTADTPNLPSPLIRDLPVFTSTVSESLIKHERLTPYQESYINPLSENEGLSGGTALLANQAKCPFRAFAAHRLHAKAGLKQSTGLNDAERGQVVHNVLEILWKELGSQQRLFNLTNTALDSLISQAIDSALTVVIPQRQSSFTPLIQTIEHERLQRIIHASLEWEKQRPPFMIKAIEQTFSLSLAGLDFRVRVDRLDTHTNDEAWVIDYKSSLPPSKPWNDERPEAPQLLLYALLDPSITALLFLQLKAGQITCSGISQEKYELTGLSTLKKEETWEEKREEWRQRLTQLALEFREGHCMPTPQRESTCLRCEFKNLCRI